MDLLGVPVLELLLIVGGEDVGNPATDHRCQHLGLVVSRWAGVLRHAGEFKQGLGRLVNTLGMDEEDTPTLLSATFRLGHAAPKSVLDVALKGVV